jgi:arylsulfatase
MTTTFPNLILIMTDQQRYDSIHALGAEYMHTPHLDRFVHEGISFDNVFVTAPSCVPSRASFFNGKYPLTMGIDNNQSRWTHSWVEQLQQAGYHTVNVGKMHTIPLDAPCGFDQRLIVENKDRPLRLEGVHGGLFDEWDKFLAHLNIPKPSRHRYKEQDPNYDQALGAFEWPLPEAYHPDVFVGRMAQWFIEHRKADSPLFMQIGFPGPHPPYDPTKQWIERYNPADFPLPNATREELLHQPSAHAVARDVMMHEDFDAVRWHLDASEGQLRRLRQYYAANVSMIDDQVGLIMHALESKGYLENAIVVFMSDHGDSLGDHGHIQKWNMYDSVVKIPCLMWSKRWKGGQRNSALLQHMDIAATLFNLVGIPVPTDWEAISIDPQSNDGRAHVFSEHARDNVYKQVQRVTMVRNHKYKLVHYLDEHEGELYDLESDPKEQINKWNDMNYAAVKEQLIQLIHDERIKMNTSSTS